MHLLLVHHSVQLSHTWSDFSRSLRVMISETRALFHFIMVLLSSTLMKQLTCSVAIISLKSIFLVWIFSWRDLVTGTDAGFFLYIIFSQFITFEQVMLCSPYFAWFCALLASLYAVLIFTCPYLFLLQLDSSVYIRI